MLQTAFRSSDQRCFIKIDVLRNFTNFPATLLKKILRHRCFPVNFVKLLRTTILQNTSGPLLLRVISSRFVLFCGRDR